MKVLSISNYQIGYNTNNTKDKDSANTVYFTGGLQAGKNFAKKPSIKSFFNKQIKKLLGLCDVECLDGSKPKYLMQEHLSPFNFKTPGDVIVEYAKVVRLGKYQMGGEFTVKGFVKEADVTAERLQVNLCGSFDGLANVKIAEISGGIGEKGTVEAIDEVHINRTGSVNGIVKARKVILEGTLKPKGIIIAEEIERGPEAEILGQITGNIVPMRIVEDNSRQALSEKYGFTNDLKTIILQASAKALSLKNQ